MMYDDAPSRPCEDCEGTGKTLDSDLYHASDDDCPTCKGTGLDGSHNHDVRIHDHPQ